MADLDALLQACLGFDNQVMSREFVCLHSGRCPTLRRVVGMDGASVIARAPGSRFDAAASEQPLQPTPTIHHLHHQQRQARKAAEKTLKQLSTHAEYVPELCKRLDAGDAHVRQLAAVLVRKVVGRLYPKLPADVQAQVRALLLQRVIQEPLHYVRRGIADVVGAVARLAVPQNQWPGAPSAGLGWDLVWFGLVWFGWCIDKLRQWLLT